MTPERIKPEELRIGNKFLLGEKEICTISELYEDEMRCPENGFLSYDQIKGIPLSKDWLERFGFRYIKASGFSGADMWQGMAAWEYKNEWLFRGEPSCLSLVGYFNTQIRFVHQLQNLFFSLTGTELKLKEQTV